MSVCKQEFPKLFVKYLALIQTMRNVSRSDTILLEQLCNQYSVLIRVFKNEMMKFDSASLFTSPCIVS